MAPSVMRICPSIVAIRMDVLLNALANRDDARINRLCTVFEKSMDDSNITMFTLEEAEYIREQLTYIHVMTLMNLYDVAIEAATNLRDMCEKIPPARMGVLYLLRATWFTPEPTDEMSLGPIDELPRLVKYEISKILEKVYNLV